MMDLRGRDLSQLIQSDEKVIWNFYNLYNPKVVRDNTTDYPYKMLFFGENTKEEAGYDSIYLARSANLTDWEIYAKDGTWDSGMRPELWKTVVQRGDKVYDNIHAGDPALVYQDGRFYLAYSSVGFDNRQLDGKDQHYIINCIMGAVSDDLIHWEKSKAPILIWENEYESGWKIEDPKPHNHGGYHRPTILYDENRWKLWFDYYLDGTFLSMGYAENDGGFLDSSRYEVVRSGDNPVLKDFPNPSMIKIGDDYFGFADPPDFDARRTTNRRTVIAHSRNGIDFTVLGHLNPRTEEGAHVAEPFLDNDGKLYLFYSYLPDHDWPRYKEIHKVELDLKKLVEISQA